MVQDRWQFHIVTAFNFRKFLLSATFFALLGAWAAGPLLYMLKEHWEAKGGSGELCRTLWRKMRTSKGLPQRWQMCSPMPWFCWLRKE